MQPYLVGRLGGAMGTHSARVSGAWAFLLGMVSWVICMFRQVPCQFPPAGTAPDRFGWMCYTDITALYYSRGQVTGGIPYIDVAWEYPVLTGYFARIANVIAGWLGADLSADIEGSQMALNANIYFAVTAVGLFLCIMWLISSQLQIAPANPGLAMAVAISPTIWATGLINWDALVIALTAAGLASWIKGKPGWAGLWWGLGVAAKLYPIVIIGALAVLCLRKPAFRTKLTRQYFFMLATAIITWSVANLPVMITQFDGWKLFYTMNYSDRGADLGSLWYALSLMGLGVPDPTTLSRAVMIMGYIGLAFLILMARKTPTVIQIAYLAVAIMMVGNLVYSPQYVLWLLPLIVLARPKVLDVFVFTCAELFYFVFIWLQLRGNDLTLGISDAPWVYILSILVRIGATIWIMSRVVRDVVTAQPDEPLLTRD